MDAVIVDGPAIELIRVGAPTHPDRDQKGTYHREQLSVLTSKPLRDVICGIRFVRADAWRRLGVGARLVDWRFAAADGRRAANGRATSRTTTGRRWPLPPVRSPASSTSSPRRSTPTAPPTDTSSSAYRQPKASDAEQSREKGGHRARAADRHRRPAWRDAPVGRRGQARAGSGRPWPPGRLERRRRRARAAPGRPRRRAPERPRQPRRALAIAPTSRRSPPNRAPVGTECPVWYATRSQRWEGLGGDQLELRIRN